MTDTPLWLDAFPHDFEVAHERMLLGLSKVTERVYYPGARRNGGRDGAWLRRSLIDRPTARLLEPTADRGLALLLDDEVHLRSGDTLHRVALRSGRTVTEPASW